MGGVTEGQFNMLMAVVNRIDSRLETISDNYAKQSDLISCQEKHDGVKIWLDKRVDALERHKDKQNGIDEERCRAEKRKREKEQQQLQSADLETQQSMVQRIWDAGRTQAVTVIIAALLTFVLTKLL